MDVSIRSFVLEELYLNQMVFKKLSQTLLTKVLSNTRSAVHFIQFFMDYPADVLDLLCL